MKRLIFALAVLTMFAVRADASCLGATRTLYVDGETIYASPMNSNEGAMWNYLEETFDPSCSFSTTPRTYWTNLIDGGYATNTTGGPLHLHSWSDIQGGTLILTAAQHGDLSAYSTSTMHTASSVALVDSNDLYTATNTEDALWEIAHAIGYSASGTVTTSTGSTMVFLDYRYFGSTGTSFTLPATQTVGLKAVIVNLHGYYFVGNGVFLQNTCIYPGTTPFTGHVCEENVMSGTDVQRNAYDMTLFYNFSTYSFTAGSNLGIAIETAGTTGPIYFMLYVYGLR